MDFVLSSILIKDHNSKLNNQKIDLLISNGIINIAKGGEENIDIFDCDGLVATPGWLDMRCHFNDPGYEYKEDLESGLLSAVIGGFTNVIILPNTYPIIQYKDDLYLSKTIESLEFPSHINFSAALTRDAKGEHLNDLIDLNEHGARFFTDGINPIWNPDILLKSLMYLQKFDGLLVQRPEDNYLNQFGSIHEGVKATELGLRGIPSLSEEIIIERDLEILRYTGGKIHFSTISSERSVEKIKKAKDEGLKVSCDVSIQQLLFDESDIIDFDANFKVNPPLRSKTDKEALIEGVKDDVIDVIVSDHRPQDQDSKMVVFDHAAYGMMTLPLFYPMLRQLEEKISFDKLLFKIINGPRKLLGLEYPIIKDRSIVNINILDPEKKWTLTHENNPSKSSNSPLFNQELTGKVMGTLLGDRKFFDPSFNAKK
ncbi:MAG TPA: dihydroorotase [Cyclobacteriaceae bacterium]